MIIEYMLVREMGGKRTPSWVEDGGYFVDPDNKTVIGWSPDLGDRDYYIPETVIELNKPGLVARVLSIHKRHPMKKPNSGQKAVVMTEEDIEALVNAWCELRNEV